MKEPSIDLPSDVVRKIRRLVSQELALAGVKDSDIAVQAGEDHDGEPAIMVRIHHRENRQPFDGRAAAQALFRLNSMLREHGEQRFAYIKHDEEAAV